MLENTPVGTIKVSTEIRYIHVINFDKNIYHVKSLITNVGNKFDDEVAQRHKIFILNSFQQVAQKHQILLLIFFSII